MLEMHGNCAIDAYLNTLNENEDIIAEVGDWIIDKSMVVAKSAIASHLLDRLSPFLSKTKVLPHEVWSVFWGAANNARMPASTRANVGGVDIVGSQYWLGALYWDVILALTKADAVQVPPDDRMKTTPVLFLRDSDPVACLMACRPRGETTE